MAGTFGRSYLLTLGTYVSVLVFGVGTSVLAARLLGPEAFGQYSLALLFAYLVITFSNCGLTPATVYHVSRHAHDRRQIVRNTVVFSLAIGVGAVAGALVFVAVWGDRFLPNVPWGFVVAVVAAVPVLHLVNNLKAVLHGLQRFRQMHGATVAEAGLKLLFIAAAILLLGGGAFGAVVANLLASTVVAGALLFGFRRVLRRGRWTVDGPYLRDSFSYGSKAFVANAIQFLNYRVDMLLLNLWFGPVSVGIYSISVLFAERLTMISTSASTVLFPRIAAAARPEEVTALVCRFAAWTTFFAALLFYVVSESVIMLLYSASYAAAVTPLQILLPAMVALSASDVIAHDFAGRGKPIVNTVLAGVTLATNVVLCVLLIPRQGAVGAALSTTISYFVQMICYLLWYWRTAGKSPLEMLVPRPSDLRAAISRYGARGAAAVRL